MEHFTDNESFKNSSICYAKNSNDNLQQFSDVEILKNHEQFISEVSQFFNDPSMSDVTISVGDTTYYAHKFILAKSSDVFRKMLYDEAWRSNECRQTNQTLNLTETDICTKFFSVFLRYMYFADVILSNESAVGVLCLADKYNVASLKHLCVNYMERNSRSPFYHNALHWYVCAKQLCLPTLQQCCFKTICWNMEEIMLLPDWLHLDITFLIDIVESSEVIVRNEYNLLQGVRLWLEVEDRLDALESYAKRLLPFIRFPMMSVAQLYQLEQDSQSHECNGTVYTQLMNELIGKAYRFRALCPRQQDLQLLFRDDFYQPRDYLDLIVDTVRIGNTIRFGFQVDVRMYQGAVPCDERTAEWKFTYRKNQNTWSLQVCCHESALVRNEARCQLAVCVFNEEDKIIQVEHTCVYTCSRTSQQNFQFDLLHTDRAKSLGVMLKPLAS